MRAYKRGACVRRSILAGLLAVLTFFGIAGIVSASTTRPANYRRASTPHDKPVRGSNRAELAPDQDVWLSPKPPGRTQDWVLAWDDEFNSPADLRKWHYRVGDIGKQQGTLQWYDSANATVDNGNLVMSAELSNGSHQCWYGPCRYTSVSMSTHGIFARTRGMFEARMKVPVEHGVWPAFWMLSTQPYTTRWSAGELDILEVNGHQDPYMAGGFGHTSSVFTRVRCFLTSPVSADYHVYGIQWSQDGITWMVDGKSCAHMKAYPGWPFTYPFYMILTLAIGGHWPGPPDSSTHFPVQMYVDWVRVYRHAAALDTARPDETGQRAH